MSLQNRQVVEEFLGYLNFSNGTPDPNAQRNFNQLYRDYGLSTDTAGFKNFLLNELSELSQSSSTFVNNQQAESVIRLVFDHCFPAYIAHHQDLFFHLEEQVFQNPFFFVRIFEAVLAQPQPWTDTETIVRQTLDQLNDYVGFRPIAVLENGRQMQHYQHEQFRPLPLMIRDAGVAVGQYQILIEKTIELLENTPKSILQESYFDLSLMDELAVDIRAHDHLHPVNKRTNYMFGEWDPHLIDQRGFYRRFVIRKIILDSLLEWIQTTQEVSQEELLYDASAVLSGTMLMASAVCGSGPNTHDSSVTLTSLLPKIARQRDAYYTRLLEQSQGARSERLKKEAELTQQPFGHVRQQLNIALTQYGAKQVQHRHLAQFFARMGYIEVSREQALKIPSLSVRFECDLQCQITEANLQLNRSELKKTYENLQKIEDLLKRGLECGALVDPWNILGFQGQFPLSASREDSIPDHRAETLLDLMEQTFNLYSRSLSEAAAQGNESMIEQFSQGFRRLAEEWDQYATTTIEDLPHVSGYESWLSANHVSRVLTEWTLAGEATGDISFWRQHVDRLESAKAYAKVVETMLEKEDLIASMGLLMQWLSQVEDVGIGSGSHSINQLLIRWLRSTMSSQNDLQERWSQIRKLFDYLEANAGDYWSVPNLRGLTETNSSFLMEQNFEEEETQETSEEDLFEAAYENVIYQDSAKDGFLGETLDSQSSVEENELESIQRSLQPRLSFISTLAQLWQLTAAALIPTAQEFPEKLKAEKIEAVFNWQTHAGNLQRELKQLLNEIWTFKVYSQIGDHESNLEYDLQVQTKFEMLHSVICTIIDCQIAQQLLNCCLPFQKIQKKLSKDQQKLLVCYRAFFENKTEKIQRLLPKLLKELSQQPLLYVRFEDGGTPDRILNVRQSQIIIHFLLSQLPRLGLHQETWTVLKVAYKMEQTSKPEGIAVTEFDRLFRTALSGSLESIIRSAEKWDLDEDESTSSETSSKTTSEDQPQTKADPPSNPKQPTPSMNLPEMLIKESKPSQRLLHVIDQVVEHYLDQWLIHSKTMNLSTVDVLKHESINQEVQTFIAKYGEELFHPKMLTLGNVRAILHNGIDNFLKYLAENQDPLHTSQILEDLEQKNLSRKKVVRILETIYSIVVEKFDRFLEYNTTTTQSDYGKMFFCFLDFLRVEAGYDRDAWNLTPLRIAHQILTKLDQHQEAHIWEKVIQFKTKKTSRKHLTKLDNLEKKYGMQLPSVKDHLNERFIKPLAVNRMVALVPQAIADLQDKKVTTSTALSLLQKEIDEYLEHTSGSAIDVPDWLKRLEKETRVPQAGQHYRSYNQLFTHELQLPFNLLSLDKLEEHLKTWSEFLQN